MAVSPTPSRTPLPPLLGEAKELLFAEFHRRLEAEGHGLIRTVHGCVFRFIDARGARLTELSERSGYTKQSVGEVVVELERLGYVERVPDPEDGRAKIIRLTALGIEAQTVALRIFAELEAEWAKAIGEKRMTALREGVEALVDLARAPARAA